MSIKNAQELKQLQSRRTKLAAKLGTLKAESSEKNREVSVTKNLLSTMDSEIESLKGVDLIVTEHAILRFLERAMSLDIAQIKDKILSSPTINNASNMPNGKYPIGEGLKAVVKDNCIVSITYA